MIAKHFVYIFLTFSLLGCSFAINSQALARFAKEKKMQKMGTFDKKITKKKKNFEDLNLVTLHKD